MPRHDCHSKAGSFSQEIKNCSKDRPNVPLIVLLQLFYARRFIASDKCFSLSLNHLKSLFLNHSWSNSSSSSSSLVKQQLLKLLYRIAVSIASIVIPCSLDRVLSFSARKVLLSKILGMVSLKSWKLGFVAPSCFARGPQV